MIILQQQQQQQKKKEKNLFKLRKKKLEGFLSLSKPNIFQKKKKRKIMQEIACLYRQTHTHTLFEKHFYFSIIFSEILFASKLYFILKHCACVENNI